MHNPLINPEHSRGENDFDYSGVPAESEISYYRSDTRPMGPRTKKILASILAVIVLTPVVLVSREVDNKRFEELEQEIPSTESLPPFNNPQPDSGKELIPEFPPLEPLEPLIPGDKPGLKPYPNPVTNNDPKSTWQIA